MKQQIVFRQYQDEDRKALENIIRITWGYDKFCTPKTAAKLAKAYLGNCLANQTFTQVAVENGKPIGIIMGKKLKGFPLSRRFYFQKIRSTIPIILSREARSVSGIFQTVEKIDQEFLRDSNLNYDAEVAFFAIHPESRGKGVGKQLFQRLMDYFKQEQLRKFYLFTDTSCNYPFYEHMGMTRRKSKNGSFQIKGYHHDMTFFLYDGQNPIK